MKEKVYTLSELSELDDMFADIFREVRVAYSFKRIMARRQSRRPITQR